MTFPLIAGEKNLKGPRQGRRDMHGVEPPRAGHDGGDPGRGEGLPGGDRVAWDVCPGPGRHLPGGPVVGRPQSADGAAERPGTPLRRRLGPVILISVLRGSVP